MRRGELWYSPSTLRNRVILLMSAQTLIDQGVTMLYGLEADVDDPGPLLLVVPVLVPRAEGEQRWINVGRGLTRVARRTLTQSYGPANDAVIGQVEALLRVALDL